MVKYDGKDEGWVLVDCRNCRGTGQNGNQRCQTCDGQGKILELKHKR